jgi:type I restriction-modification system DNA methylase subunit
MAGAKTHVSDCSQVAARNGRTCLRGQNIDLFPRRSRDRHTVTPSTTTVTLIWLANPPFNISDRGGERLVGDQALAVQRPPRANANFAWMQHITRRLTA